MLYLQLIQLWETREDLQNYFLWHQPMGNDRKITIWSHLEKHASHAYISSKSSRKQPIRALCSRKIDGHSTESITAILVNTRRIITSRKSRCFVGIPGEEWSGWGENCTKRQRAPSPAGGRRGAAGGAPLSAVLKGPGRRRCPRCWRAPGAAAVRGAGGPRAPPLSPQPRPTADPEGPRGAGVRRRLAILSLEAIAGRELAAGGNASSWTRNFKSHTVEGTSAQSRMD